MARNKVVPESKKALDILKYEIAAELGLPVGKHLSMNVDTEFATELGSVSSYSGKKESWGHLTSRDNGAVGGRITQRLIQRAEETLFSL
ncbi:alpha/beta-type small acid-soluble spore protein [Paenibacillus roseipurpureus]|uniref:Alpha/beta-type small acid-soluble spore protein n=1 Tax=Paenibacillus roseopurpureus TaxID=2918901 RepID=A0AA96LRF9_9BACL|nr:alpha/beta-type small acid-soluble spore protein [Paenibacillus sp. MBLB1832]WNR44679.1 alpha/beta-type small acid-soluble spore protein [Paenibacillus sp. MBLB1832]